MKKKSGLIALRLIFAVFEHPRRWRWLPWTARVRTPLPTGLPSPRQGGGRGRHGPSQPQSILPTPPEAAQAVPSAWHSLLCQQLLCGQLLVCKNQDACHVPGNLLDSPHSLCLPPGPFQKIAIIWEALGKGYPSHRPSAQGARPDAPTQALRSPGFRLPGCGATC